MFKIDGVEYDGTACIVDGITESFSLVEGNSSRRLQSGDMWYNIIGTETSHTVTLRRDNAHISAWESLWSKLKEPVSFHIFEFPGCASYKGHISSGSRQLEFINGSTNYFGDYSITIEPAEILEVNS